MTQPLFDARLQAAAATLGVPLMPAQRVCLLSFLQQLQRWNKTYNLTALRDPEQMLIQHLFDSLSVLPHLARELADCPSPLIVDVGSGGGLPGVVLAAVRPDWQVCCVDAVEKKTAFIRQMAGVLGLNNLSVRHARVETLPPLQAHLVVSRAFASLVDFVTLAGRHVQHNGRLVAMKGRVPQDEMCALHAENTWQVQTVQNLTVPELDAQRCLVWITRPNGLAHDFQS